MSGELRLHIRVSIFWQLIAYLIPVASLHAATARGGPDVAYLALTNGIWQVWTMHDDGSNPHQVTRTVSDKTRISWFPHGNRLLVNDNQGLVSAVDLSTGKTTAVDLGLKPVLDAVLSPDGTQIAFSFNGADSPDGHDLWIESVSGAGRRRLTDMPGLQHEPTWSSDGESLYFLSGSGKQTHDIWRLELRSGNREQLTAADLYHFDVAAAPDGTLAFSGNRSGSYELYLQPVKGQAFALTHDAAFAGHPNFSPDGRQLLFESTRSGTLEIWKLELASRQLTQITRRPGGARAPVWRSQSGPVR